MVRIYDAEFSSGGNAHHHIETFWWIDGAGNKGKWSRAEAYSYVVAHPKIVYVAEAGRQVLVGDRQNPQGTKWIQTYADGYWRDNLTTLAERHRQGLPNL